MFDVLIRELKKNELDSITNLFDEHRDDPFTYLADVQLFRMFSQLKPFGGFVAQANGKVIGCVYALRYLYGCGWIGGLHVHRGFRRKGIGRKLLRAALDFLGSGYVYLFVEPQNSVARSLFESMGFRSVYRRLNYVADNPIAEFENTCENITDDVGWDDMNNAVGFKERERVIHMGYYPIKVTKDVFEDLKRRQRVLRCGNVVVIVENSHCLKTNRCEFTFNQYIQRGISDYIPRRSVVEVNPFYIKREPSNLVKLINHLTRQGEVELWTYEKDPVLTRLPLTGALAAMVMELHQ